MTPFSISNINSINSTRLGMAGRDIISNDPTLRKFIDWMLTSLTGRTRSGLSNTGVAFAELIGGFLSGMGKGGETVSAFGGLNEILASMPMHIREGNAESTSFGAGINSISIAQQISKEIQNNSDLVNGFEGLSPALAIGTVGNVIKEKGNVGLVNNINFDTTSDKVRAQLKELKDQGNISEKSEVYKRINKMADAMSALERHNAAIGDISDGLKNQLKDSGFSEEDIMAADKARSGKLNATFLDETSMNELKSGIRKYSDTVKSMSELFNTDDFRQLEQQAKQLGINSMTSATGADQIRRLTREAVSSALATGRTTDEILKDMGAIASVTAATNNGRASFTEVLRMQNVMDEATLTDRAGRSTGIYTANERAVIAQNQVLEANDIMKYVYAAEKGIRDGAELGTISKEDVAKFEEITSQLNEENFKGMDPAQVKSEINKIVRQAATFARSKGVDVYDKNLQAAGIADKSKDYTDLLAGAYGRNEINKWLKKDLKGTNTSDDDIKKISDVTETIFEATGINDKLFDDTMKLLSQKSNNKISQEEFIKKAVDLGYTEEEALSISMGMTDRQRQAIKNVRDRRAANLKSESLITRRRKDAEANARFVAENSDLSNARGQTGSDFVAGLVGENGFTDKEKAAMYAMRLLKTRTVGEFSGVEKDEQDRLKFKEEDLKYGGTLQKTIAPEMSEAEWNSIKGDIDKLDKKLGDSDVRLEYDPTSKTLKMKRDVIDDVTNIEATKMRDGKFRFGAEELKYGGDLQYYLAPEMSKEEWATKSRDINWINEQLTKLKDKGYEVDTSNTSRISITNKLTQDGKLKGEVKVGRKADGSFDFSSAPEDVKKFGGELYKLIGNEMSEEEWNSFISDNKKVNDKIDYIYKLRYSATDNKLKLYEQNIHKVGQLGTDGKLTPGSMKEEIPDSLMNLFEYEGDVEKFKKEWKEATASGVVRVNEFINKYSDNKYSLTLGENGEMFIVNTEGANAEFSEFYKTDKSRSMAMIAAFGEDVDINKDTGDISGKIGDQTFQLKRGAEGDPKKLAEAIQKSVTAKKFASVLMKAAEGDATAIKARDAYLYELMKGVSNPARSKELDDIKSRSINMEEWTNMWKKGMGIDIGKAGIETRDAVGTSDADAKFMAKTEEILNEHIKKVGDSYVMQDDTFGRAKGDKLSEAEYKKIKEQLKENIEVAANVSKHHAELKEKAAGPGGEDSQGKMVGIMDNIYKLVAEIADKIRVGGGVTNS